MSAPPEKAKSRTWNGISVLARWVLGLAFMYMGLVKALEPHEFLVLVREYNVVSSPLFLNSIASFLPWFEVFCGLLLITGVAVRGTALVLIAMLLPFTTLIVRRAIALTANGLPFCAIKFDCGCGAGEVLICNKLIENAGLILVCCWLLWAPSRRFCLRFNLIRDPAEKLAPDVNAAN